MLRPGVVALAGAFFVLIGAAVPAHAQIVPRPTGNVAVMADWFPNRVTTGPSPFVGPTPFGGPTFRPGVGDDVGRAFVPGQLELRARLFLEQKLHPFDRISFTFSGFAEGLLGRAETGIARVHEAATSMRFGRFDLYAGYGRVVWGRLDELQPTDVINPLDISRFFFEGRSEARLPVAVIRGRWYATDDLSLEAVYVPFFRRGRFDQLEEATSPFNVVPPFTTPDVSCLAAGCPPLVVAVERVEPSARWSHGQGGARVNGTAAAVDWSVSAYRGFEPFGLYQVRPGPPALPLGLPRPVVEEGFPRFTMVGGDFETVAGQWGIRGELAAFVEDSLQGQQGETFEGTSIDAGLGVDRRAGSYRFGATVLLHRERAGDLADGGTEVSPYTPRSDVSVIASADRTFARERYQLRAFSVYNPSERSSFLRGIFTAKLRDDVALEGSGGWFGGDGRDTVGRFSDSDFVYARLRYYW